VTEPKAVPLILLTGFLGSGKTTLLTRLISEYRARGLEPAVIMNEIGEINLDGQLVDRDIQMAELLSGCVCCTVRGDLGLEVRRLIMEHKPDVILIEASGVANPMEILDAASEASMLEHAAVEAVIAVVDAPHVLERYHGGKNRTLKLMEEQIRCASTILLNKADLLEEKQLEEMKHIVSNWNRYAVVVPTIQAAAPFDRIVGSDTDRDRFHGLAGRRAGAGSEEAEASEHGNGHGHHHSHAHVMVYTHYFDRPIHSEAFEKLFEELPSSVYRAKGILSFTDTASRFMFQYAYGQLDFAKVQPQEGIPDVAVFIGEHFSKDEVKTKLDRL
jgi:G3E family GTPase